MISPADELAAKKTRENYLAMGESEKRIQTSLWTLNFLIAELASGLVALRQILAQKGVLTEADLQELASVANSPEVLQTLYRNTEMAFAEKFQRIRFAIENPEAVASALSKQGNTNV